ncbi:MAG: hypothetical protein FWD31_03300 [Planctomycetaceae bacterium]|nr:hypothetical protein [Planctomycetaceae bacterium]
MPFAIAPPPDKDRGVFDGRWGTCSAAEETRNAQRPNHHAVTGQDGLVAARPPKPKGDGNFPAKAPEGSNMSPKAPEGSDMSHRLVIAIRFR